ncbi:MAG: hypothetical protein U1E78_08160, partial [Gammaproteobacteria bacterium]
YSLRIYCMQYRKSIISVAILILSILVTGFTNLTHPIDPPRKPIPGDPDPEAGIVVKFDSTAEDILADSSQNIKFKALLYSGNTKIRHLSIGLFDQAPKRFRLIDDACGFVADETYYAAASFPEDKNSWRGITFAPFLPGLSKTDSEIKPILDTWIKFFNQSGWKTVDPEPEKDSWVPYQLPYSGIPDASVYQIWSCDKHKATIVVYKKNISPKEKETFYMRIMLDN